MAERKGKSTAASRPAASPDSPTDEIARRDGYTVIARRYRPQRFEDFVGQDVIVEALKKAITSNRVAHAYLFTGARGTGKTSMARVFSRALNCEQGPTVSPCGVCESCQAIAVGQDVDVLEIDGASNNGVENIRELRQTVAYRPTHSRFKIYVIDEVHMVTTAAFNALLKTLEEPPAHVKFIFATTEPQKVPITILSRCQRYDFSGVAADRIQQRLREIVESEGFEADDDALEIVSRRANGSMRDSQSLLDQVIAYVGGAKKISADDAYKALGVASDQRVQELVAAILSGNAKAALELAEQGATEGVQLGDWVEQSLDYFRDLMVLTVDPDAPLVASSPKRRGELLDECKGIATERILELMDLLAACRSRMKTSTYARTLFEMSLVRMCRIDQFVGVERALQTMRPVQSPQSPARPAPTAPPSTSSMNQPPRPASPTPAPTASTPPAATEKKTLHAAAPGEETSLVVQEAMNVDASNWRRFWQSFLEELNTTDQVLAGILHESERIDCPGPNQLTIFVPGGLYGTCKTYAEHAKTRLDAATRRAAGRPVTLKFEIGTPAKPTAPPSDSPTKLRDEAARDPWVRAAEELFGAKIVSVDRLAAATTPAAVAAPPADSAMEEEDDS
jgi:DNA polymerase-3 subunit gamma/tau